MGGEAQGLDRETQKTCGGSSKEAASSNGDAHFRGWWLWHRAQVQPGHMVTGINSRPMSRSSLEHRDALWYVCRLLVSQFCHKCKERAREKEICFQRLQLQLKGILAFANVNSAKQFWSCLADFVTVLWVLRRACFLTIVYGYHFISFSQSSRYHFPKFTWNC